MQARSQQRHSTQQARLAVYREAVDILAKEFARPIRIEEVARRVAVSPRQLQRVFSEEGGLGFRSYLRRVRMSHALHLLATTDLPVKEIASRVGYGDPSQFSKAFKDAYGATPSACRGEPASGRVATSPRVTRARSKGTRWLTAGTTTNGRSAYAAR